MGTRADFYTGVRKLKWIGSLDWGCHHDGERMKPLVRVRSRAGWNDFVRRMQKESDWHLPRDGWPHPWTDSRTTDYAFWFNGKKVMVLGTSEDRFEWQPLHLLRTLEEASVVVELPEFPNWNGSLGGALLVTG